jgi:hypothetical protein
MKTIDTVFIGLLATLALAVLIFERCTRQLPPSLQPIPPRDSRIDRMNVPANRDNSDLLEDVAYIDPSTAERREYV